MARYEIVVTDEGFDQSRGPQWEASVFPVNEDGESGNLIAAGTAEGALDAVVEALEQWRADG